MTTGRINQVNTSMFEPCRQESSQGVNSRFKSKLCHMSHTSPDKTHNSAFINCTRYKLDAESVNSPTWLIQPRAVPSPTHCSGHCQSWPGEAGLNGGLQTIHLSHMAFSPLNQHFELLSRKVTMHINV